MEVAPSNGSSSESDSSGPVGGSSENRTSSNARVLSPQLLANPDVSGGLAMTYKQWQYPGYNAQHDVSRDGAAPVLYYYPPLQTGPITNGYQQQPYYYCNTTPQQQSSQQHAHQSQGQTLPQMQQHGSSQYPRPKVYQFPGFQEPQQQAPLQQPHVQTGPVTSPNVASQQPFALQQFSPSPAPYQVNNTSVTPLNYMAPQPSYDSAGPYLSPPSAVASLARRPAPAGKQTHRPMKQRDAMDFPQELRVQSYDVAVANGQMTRPRVTTTMWEDEKTLCYQVEANGVSVVRRADNDMINGTKLLNVAKITRGRRDGILKAERIRHVVKIGSMHLKGVWIPFERAHAMAQREKIVDYLYPLFVKDIQSVLKQTSSDVTEPLPPPAAVAPPQPTTAMLPPQQNHQEEDLANPQPHLSYDMTPSWFGSMSSRSHASPQPYRNTLSYGQYQSVGSSSTTPPTFQAPVPAPYHQSLPTTAYHTDFASIQRPQDRGSATSNSTSSSNTSAPSNAVADSLLNPSLSGPEIKTNTDHNPKNNTPGKLLTGIQPPQPLVDGTESDEKAQDSTRKRDD